MRTLKQEEVYLANYENYLDVVDNLPRFIEEVYNEKRVHSGIEYMTPNEFEERIRKEPSNPNNRRFDLPL
jgi:putative transposase